MKDITGANQVEIIIDRDGKRVWVNADEECAARCCQVGKITIEDRRPDDVKTIQIDSREDWIRRKFSMPNGMYTVAMPQEVSMHIDSLEGKLDIIKRENAGDDDCNLAMDYGGTGWEMDPTVVKVREMRKLLREIYQVLEKPPVIERAVAIGIRGKIISLIFEVISDEEHSNRNLDDGATKL